MSVYWETEIPLVVRSLINDLGSPPTYSDSRLIQLTTIAARYTIMQVNFPTTYNIDIVNETISPDPSDPNNRDIEFVGLVALKCACILDESTFRTKLALEGIRASLGSASLSIAGNISGYKTLLDQGPCALFEQLTLDYNIGNASAIAAILSPFVGNEFDPKYGLRGAPINGGFFNDFYS